MCVQQGRSDGKGDEKKHKFWPDLFIVIFFFGWSVFRKTFPVYHGKQACLLQSKPG